MPGQQAVLPGCIPRALAFRMVLGDLMPSGFFRATREPLWLWPAPAHTCSSLLRFGSCSCYAPSATPSSYKPDEAFDVSCKGGPPKCLPVPFRDRLSKPAKKLGGSEGAKTLMRKGCQGTQARPADMPWHDTSSPPEARQESVPRPQPIYGRCAIQLFSHPVACAGSLPQRPDQLGRSAGPRPPQVRPSAPGAWRPAREGLSWQPPQ